METTNPSIIQIEVPNSTSVLVLGIISISTCWCFGFPGLICGIVALVLTSKSEKMYRADPALYKESSYNNLKAGKICAIIGVCLSSFMAISTIIATFLGALDKNPWEHFRY